MRRTAASALLLLVALGCGSSPPARHYLLGDGPGAPGTEGTVAIGIGPIALPDYLARPQIVRRKAENELMLSELHRWAEPLEVGFARALADGVARRTGSSRIYRFPWSGRPRIDCRVEGTVTRFDADSSGEVVLIVEWSVKWAEEDPEPRRGRYASPSSAGDYPGIVAAMSRTVESFAADVARACEPSDS